MNQVHRRSWAEPQRYALAGALFGLLFPVIATLIRMTDSNLPYDLSSAIAVQTRDSVLWIIDTAPVFLGLLAFFVGHRQSRLQNTNYELKQRERELQEIKANLEKSIEERTLQLVIANRQTTRRAEQLKLIADVARSAISIQNVGQLLPHIAHLIGQRFNFYHVGIFLLDEDKRYAILRASNSAGGIRMIQKGHRLRVGTQGIVGFVSQTGQVRIAREVKDDPSYFGGVDLPDTRSEITLPLKSGEIILGVLDIQSTEANAFSEDDSATLTILADQMAIAIQNAISYEQSQRALREAESASRQAMDQAWSGYRKEMEGQGYQYDGVKADLLKDASAVSVSNNILSLPVRVRGQTIGHLKLNHPDASQALTEDELAMAEATAERVAIALEGARLLQEAQKRAARETFLSQMTAKLGTSFQIDSILRDTVEELGQTLRHSTITFQLVDPSEPTGTDGRHNGSSALEQGQE